MTTALPPWHPRSPDRRTSFALAEFVAAYPRESDYVEWKAGVGRDPIQKSLVAFSNSDGGVLLVGVGDDGRPLTRGRCEAWSEAVHAAASDARDVGRYSCHRLAVDDFHVLAVQCHQRTQGFAQTSGGLILVRRGPRNVPIYGADLASFVSARAFRRFECQSSGYSLGDVDADWLADLCGAFGWRPDSAELADRLRERGLVEDAPSTAVTVAGALYLVPAAHDSLGKAFVEVRRYPGEGVDYDRREIFRGPLQVQVREVTSFVAQELGYELVVSGHTRHELPKLPWVVLREAVANAVAHRTYETSGTPAVVEIRPDRVVVRSPGGLLEPVTEENIREAQAARNVNVIDVLRRFRLAEDAGRGVDVMQDSMAAAMLDPPRFVDRGHAVEVTLPIRSPVTPAERAWLTAVEDQGRLEPSDRLLLVHAARGETLTNARARAILGVDSLRARAALKRLVDVGMLVKEGNRAGTAYHLNQTVRRRAVKNDPLAELIQHARSDGLTNQKVRELAGLDRESALRLLNFLVDTGMIRRVGERRGTRYVAADPEDES